jgi:hypothetical protein
LLQTLKGFPCALVRGNDFPYLNARTRDPGTSAAYALGKDNVWTVAGFDCLFEELIRNHGKTLFMHFGYLVYFPNDAFGKPQTLLQCRHREPPVPNNQALLRSDESYGCSKNHTQYYNEIHSMGSKKTIRFYLSV